MKEFSEYKCEYCGTVYSTEAEALACEASHKDLEIEAFACNITYKCDVCGTVYNTKEEAEACQSRHCHPCHVHVKGIKTVDYYFEQHEYPNFISVIFEDGTIAKYVCQDNRGECFEPY